jgi:UDP-N-acetylmuramate dehydrogenase
MIYYKNFQLKNYNSFKLNSIVSEIWFPESVEELKSILITLKDNKFFVIAGGTNVLLKPKIDKIICLTLMPKYCNSYVGGILNVSANYNTSTFINKINSIGISGFEGLFGIPGKIGGAVVMNAGSGRYTINDNLLSVNTLDYNGNVRRYSKKELNLDRRYSILQDRAEIVTEITFIINYKNKINESELEKAINHRKSLPKEPSAGGCFKNWHSLKPYTDKLIGLRVGDAEVSKSINIIINKGNATFNDIETLINKIRWIIKESLFLEIKIMG